MSELLEQYKSAYRDSAGFDSSYSVEIYDKEINGTLYVVIDGMVVIEVPEVNALISPGDTENEIDLVFDSNQIVGRLNIIDKNKKMSNTSELSKSKLLYCIYSIHKGNFDSTGNFSTNYVLIDENFCERYINEFLETSSLWGGFSHMPRSFIYQPTITSIDLPTHFNFPTPHNEELSFSSIFASNPLEKFLKDYHQLELLFNLIIIKKVQNIHISNINEINNIYKDLRKNEIDSILYIFENFIDNDEVYLKIIIDTFKNYENLCEKFLQNYARESNPLADSKKWQKFKLFVNKADQDNCRSMDEFYNAAVDSNVGFAQPNKRDDFIKLIKKINAYWIYRIRCSIAHTKLGEFIFEYSEENHKFIFEQANLLLRTTILSIFSNPQFKSLFP